MSKFKNFLPNALKEQNSKSLLISTIHNRETDECPYRCWIYFTGHCYVSLFHLMRAIARTHASTHASTRASSLMCVKNSTHHLFIDIYRLGHWNEENERGTKAWHLVVDQFSLTFVTFSWAWMLYFHAWLQNNRKPIVRGEYDN